MLSGNVLITGGTGSLGKALLKRARRESWPASISILARNETKMNMVLSEFPEVRGIVGDVRDRDYLTTVFPGHDLIIHAAAIKIVPVAESSPVEAVKTNILGSLNVAQAAIESKIPRVIGISTDKACGPTYYGNSKRLMEGIFRQACAWGSTIFSLCRYGNVLKSANSIVPLFETQVANDVPFTITDLRMTRFWLSMEQAIDIVLNGAACNAGEILVPKAPAMKVKDLALALDPFREVREIGIRPGERLHETLIVREEAQHTREEDGHFIIYPPTVPEAIRRTRCTLPFDYEYTSDDPDHWLEAIELLLLLEDS